MNKSELLVCVLSATWIGLAFLADHLYDPQLLEPRAPMAEIGFSIRMTCKWLAADPSNNLKQLMYSLLARFIIFAEFSFWVLRECIKSIFLAVGLLAIALYNFCKDAFIFIFALPFDILIGTPENQKVLGLK